MELQRIIAFIIFYLSIICMILFTYFYIQKYYSHEATHNQSGLLPVWGILTYDSIEMNLAWIH